MSSRLSIARIRWKQVTTSLRELVYRFLRGLLISLDFINAADILKATFNRSVGELVTPCYRRNYKNIVKLVSFERF
jgi:hypothetical protein